jgi:hypothetical protein
VVGSVKQEEGQVEDITGQKNSGAEDRDADAGTFSAPTRRKGKQPIV